MNDKNNHQINTVDAAYTSKWYIYLIALVIIVAIDIVVPNIMEFRISIKSRSRDFIYLCIAAFHIAWGMTSVIAPKDKKEKTIGWVSLFVATMALYFIFMDYMSFMEMRQWYMSRQ